MLRYVTRWHRLQPWLNESTRPISFTTARCKGNKTAALVFGIGSYVICCWKLFTSTVTKVTTIEAARVVTVCIRTVKDWHRSLIRKEMGGLAFVVNICLVSCFFKTNLKNILEGDYILENIVPNHEERSSLLTNIRPVKNASNLREQVNIICLFCLTTIIYFWRTRGWYNSLHSGL